PLIAQIVQNLSHFDPRILPAVKLGHVQPTYARQIALKIPGGRWRKRQNCRRGVVGENQSKKGMFWRS
ncbi:MAG: hypothetical protein ACE10C_00240, partial [Candidatus Binatia bacterium]